MSSRRVQAEATACRAVRRRPPCTALSGVSSEKPMRALPTNMIADANDVWRNSPNKQNKTTCTQSRFCHAHFRFIPFPPANPRRGRLRLNPRISTSSLSDISCKYHIRVSYEQSKPEGNLSTYNTEHIVTPYTREHRGHFRSIANSINTGLRTHRKHSHQARHHAHQQIVRDTHAASRVKHQLQLAQHVEHRAPTSSSGGYTLVRPDRQSLQIVACRYGWGRRTAAVWLHYL